MRSNRIRHKRKKCPAVDAGSIPEIRVLMIKAKLKKAKPKIILYPQSIACKAPLFGACAFIRFPAIRDNSSWRVGFIQACSEFEFNNIYTGGQISRWELPHKYKSKYISDAHESSMPFFGPHRESVLIKGPRNRVWHGMIVMEDILFSETVLFTSNGNSLISSNRKQSFILWLAVQNCETKAIKPLRTIKWSVETKIECSRCCDFKSIPYQDICEDMFEVGPECQQEPCIFIENIPILEECLKPPLLSDIQHLMWH